MAVICSLQAQVAGCWGRTPEIFPTGLADFDDLVVIGHSAFSPLWDSSTRRKSQPRQCVKVEGRAPTGFHLLATGAGEVPRYHFELLVGLWIHPFGKQLILRRAAPPRNPLPPLRRAPDKPESEPLPHRWQASIGSNKQAPDPVVERVSRDTTMNTSSRR
jgi:hypothetical protein